MSTVYYFLLVLMHLFQIFLQFILFQYKYQQISISYNNIYKVFMIFYMISPYVVIRSSFVFTKLKKPAAILRRDTHSRNELENLMDHKSAGMWYTCSICFPIHWMGVSCGVNILYLLCGQLFMPNLLLNCTRIDWAWNKYVTVCSPINGCSDNFEVMWVHG